MPAHANRPAPRAPRAAPAARLLVLALALLWPAAARAQVVVQRGQDVPVTQVELSSGRSYPIAAPAPITRVSVADTAVMDVVVVSDRELVINGRRSGEADAIVWLANGTRQHYRVLVRSQSDRMQIVLSVKFAEVRRDLLTQLGVSFAYEAPNVRVETGTLTGRDASGNILLQPDRFINVLTDLGTSRLLALIEANTTRGNARVLAEPNLMAGNRDTATFLAGGEIPIPIVQGAAVGGLQSVTIFWREFGIKLRFVGEIISDDLLRLSVVPEVSTLDYANAVELGGFRIPALRTRRMSSTLDVRREQSLVISGMFNNEQEKVKSGIPGLMDLPILGQLFSSTRWQRNETELLIVVRPVIIDPRRPRAQDVVPTPPDTALPARDVLQRRDPLRVPFEPKKP